MTYLITLLFTFVLVALALIFFVCFGVPVYRLDKDNVKALLELIISGGATESDWDVFAGVPIRHDPELAAIQQHCLAIAEHEYCGGKQLFTPQGIEQFSEILSSMVAAEAIEDEAKKG